MRRSSLIAAEQGWPLNSAPRSADHLEWVDDEDIRALSQSGTVATLLPGTAFNLGLAKYPPARKLIEAGVPVALATDFNPGSCFTLNMQLILSIACSQMKMTPAEGHHGVDHQRRVLAGRVGAAGEHRGRASRRTSS